MSCSPNPVPLPNAVELSVALARLDRPDRVRWQAAGLLAYRRPPGTDRLITELGGGSWRARGARLLARLCHFPGRRRTLLSA